MEKFYNVKNRSTSVVVYRIPELNIRREFAPGETKRIEFEELEKLTWQPGGRELIANYLQCQEEVVNAALNIETENEYYMSEQQVIELLKNGSLEAFQDALDFAPIGVIDLIKKFAVDLPLNDVQKNEALKSKTGFDALKAIENQRLEVQDEAALRNNDQGSSTAQVSRRRTNIDYKTTATPSPQKYKVISK